MKRYFHICGQLFNLLNFYPFLQPNYLYQYLHEVTFPMNGHPHPRRVLKRSKSINRRVRRASTQRSQKIAYHWLCFAFFAKALRYLWLNSAFSTAPANFPQPGEIGKVVLNIYSLNSFSKLSYLVFLDLSQSGLL